MTRAEMRRQRRGRRCAQGLVLLVLAVAGSPSAQLNPDIDKKAIGSLRETWVRALRGKQLEQAVDLYVDDAVFFQPVGSPVTGRANIRALFATVMKTYDSDIQLDSKALGVSGNLAYDSGTYQELLVTIANGTKQQLTGSYLMVLKREPRGKWKIVQHMWTQGVSTSQ